MTAVAIVLSALGGLAEALGLVLVWREIAADRERGRRLLETIEKRPPPERTYPPTTVPWSAVTPRWASPGFAASMQIRGIVEKIEGLEASVANALVGLKKATDAELDVAMAGLEEQVVRRDRELADGLRYVLAGSARQRQIGAGLLFVGIVLATAGSVLGNLA